MKILKINHVHGTSNPVFRAIIPERISNPAMINAPVRKSKQQHELTFMSFNRFSFK